MLVLVVDSSTPAVTAALVRVGDDDVTVLSERVTVDGKAHGELLAPHIEAVLTEGGATARDLTAVVAGTGPGPFTGLRVGMVTATALAHALAVPVYGVCSLDGIGHGLPGPVFVATDARRKEVYWATYRDGVRVEGPAVGRPDDVVLALGGAVHRVAGDGAERYAAVFGGDVVGARYPSARALAEVAADRIRAKAPSETLTPLYLRRPDAVAPGERKPALQ